MSLLAHKTQLFIQIELRLARFRFRSYAQDFQIKLLVKLKKEKKEKKEKKAKKREKKKKEAEILTLSQ
jgi:hypothetical protein